jgi:hypothetical protein
MRRSEQVRTFRAAVQAAIAANAATARRNDRIGAGCSVDEDDALWREVAALRAVEDEALRACQDAFALKPVTYGGRKHAAARMRIMIAIGRMAR